MKCPATEPAFMGKPLSAGPRIIKRKNVLAGLLLVEFNGKEVSGLRLVGRFDIIHLGGTAFQLGAWIQVARGRKAESCELNLEVIVSVRVQRLRGRLHCQIDVVLANLAAMRNTFTAFWLWRPSASVRRRH